MKITLKDRALDKYFAYPILCDLVLIALILLSEYLIRSEMISHRMPLINALNSSSQVNYFSSIISTIVALTGFMVAALTILITVKASLKARGFNDSENALEYIFTTDRYKEIIGVFMHTITELIILLILSYLIWMYSDNINNVVISKFQFSVTFAMATSIIRSVYIFFKVLKLEDLKK